MWGYLSEFWDSIFQVTLNAWEYTTAWFENIGNAVAGAVGNLLYSTLHYLNDTWVFLGWVFSLISNLISLFLLPLNYVIQFLRGFLVSVFSTPETFSYNWGEDILAVFNAIPYWSTMSIALGVCIFIFVIFFVLRAFSRV